LSPIAGVKDGLLMRRIQKKHPEVAVVLQDLTTKHTLLLQRSPPRARFLGIIASKGSMQNSLFLSRLEHRV